MTSNSISILLVTILSVGVLQLIILFWVIMFFKLAKKYDVLLSTSYSYRVFDFCFIILSLIFNHFSKLSLTPFSNSMMFCSCPRCLIILCISCRCCLYIFTFFSTQWNFDTFNVFIATFISLCFSRISFILLIFRICCQVLLIVPYKFSCFTGCFRNLNELGLCHSYVPD